jgi:hypothetical protein
MSDKLKQTPPLIHCKVTVTKVTNPSTGAEEYLAEYDPKILEVTDNDTILSFKLTGKTPDDILISSITPLPEDNTQLSTPSISRNRRSATLTDINTEKQTLNLQFKFCPKHNPSARLAMCEVAVDGIYPEVDNDPPIP